MFSALIEYGISKQVEREHWRGLYCDCKLGFLESSGDKDGCDDHNLVIDHSWGDFVDGCILHCNVGYG